MRPGQGAIAGAWGRAPLGANIGLWAMASQNTNYDNVLGSSTRQNILSHLEGKKAGLLQNFSNNMMGKNSKWSQQNAHNKPQVKRLNQENRPRFNALHTNKKNKVKAGNKYNKTIEDKKCEASIPVEALHCHMCDLGDFGSISDYISHLEGTNHSLMAEYYSTKCTANVEIFRAEAKITSLRAIAKSPENVKQEITNCNKCQCKLSGSLATHEKSSEHLQVLNYLGVRCCGTSLNSRIELEEHWLSLQHIQFRSKLFAKYKDQGFTLQNEEANKQKLSAQAIAEPNCDVSTWPAFDPTVPVGLKYVDIGASNKCNVCCEYLEPWAVVILNHCCSSKHYQNMCIFYKDLQNNKAQISCVKKETVVHNKNQIQAKDESILNFKESRENYRKIKLPSKVEWEKPKVSINGEDKSESPVVADKSESPVVADKSESPVVADKSESPVVADKSKSNVVADKGKTNIPNSTTTTGKEADPEDDYGTVLDPSILDESKNESLIEEKSDKEKSALENVDKNEDMEDDIIETVQENKDNSTNVGNEDNVKDIDGEDEHEKASAEKRGSADLSSSSSKLAVITEEECDECENGSSECKKHGDKNVEGTPKKMRRTEEPGVTTPPKRNTRRRSISEEPTVSTPTRSSRRKSISEEPTVATTPTRTSTRRRSISQL